MTADLEQVESIIDRQAEAAVLGSVMLAHLDGTDLMPDLMEIIAGPSDFYQPFHEAVWRTLVAMWEGQEPLDVVAVTARVGEFLAQGIRTDPTEVFALVQGTPTWANASYYARIVADKGTKRALANAGTRIVQMAHSDQDAQFLVEQSRSMLDQAVRSSADIRSLHEDFLEFSPDFGSAQLGYPTPWQGLSETLGGFVPGRFYVVGARPGVGKSLWAGQVAHSLAQAGPVAFSSLEMTRQELLIRFVSMMGEVPAQNLQGLREMTEQDRRRVAGVALRIGDVPVYVDDRSSITPTSVGSHARTVRRHQGALSGVIVDYLQLMSVGGKVESRQQEVSTMSRALKLLAKDLEVPVIALAQLNREVEKRVSKTPALADLRESGSLEQDADVVILLSMDVETDEETGQEFESSSVVRMHVAKNRHGPLGLMLMNREGHYSRMSEIGGGR